MHPSKRWWSVWKWNHSHVNIPSLTLFPWTDFFPLEAPSYDCVNLPRVNWPRDISPSVSLSSATFQTVIRRLIRALTNACTPLLLSLLNDWRSLPACQCRIPLNGGDGNNFSLFFYSLPVELCDSLFLPLLTLERCGLLSILHGLFTFSKATYFLPVPWKSAAHSQLHFSQPILSKRK